MQITFPHMGLFSIPFKTLIEGLGHKVVLPPPTNKITFELGSKYSPEFACLPFKINLGNFIEALENGADTIVMAGGKGPCRFGYYAQIQKEILKDLGYDFTILLLDPPQTGTKELSRAVKVLLCHRSPKQIAYAFKIAWAKTKLLDQGNKIFCQYLPRVKDTSLAHKVYERFLKRVEEEKIVQNLSLILDTLIHNLEILPVNKDKQILRVKIIGEIFMVLEPRVNFYLEDALGHLGVHVERQISFSSWVEEHLLGTFFPHHRYRTNLLAKPYLESFVGGHGRETIAETVDAAINKLDGVIQVLPFTCMPEIVAQSILPDLSQKFNIPILTLVIDEHSGEAGLMTRLEAFVDLLRWKGLKQQEVIKV